MTAGTHTKKPVHHARIAHQLPGRLRIKLDHTSRAPQTMHAIQHGLAKRKGVKAVSADPTTGSMTIHYDTHQSRDHILGFLNDLDVVTAAVTQAPTVGEGGTTDFASAVEQLGAYIQNTTGIPLDLRLTLPLGFAAAGVYSIATEGLMIQSIPGPLFLWFAFDTFVKLHPAKAAPGHAHLGS